MQQSAASETRLISGGEIHVWQARLDVPADQWNGLQQTLGPSELERAGRFASVELRRRFIAGRGLLRAVLGRCLNRLPESLEFVYGPYGKPALPPECGADLRFNLSHSGEWLIIAAARGREVGIDIEQVQPQRDLASLAATCLTPSEKEVFDRTADPQKPDCFFTYWVRKEAFLKARGTGLSLKPRNVGVSPPHETPHLQYLAASQSELDGWALRDLPAPDGYKAALAAEAGPLRLHFHPQAQIA